MIKDTLEVLDGVKVVGVVVKKALADGKISLTDLSLLLGIVPQFQTLVTATEDAAGIPNELKTLTPDEATLVVAKVFEVIAAIKAA